MQRRVFTLVAEPRDDLYAGILDFAVRECRVASLVVRKSLPLSTHGMAVQQQLQGFLRSTVESVEWPGTKLLDETASVSRYDLGPGCVDVLKRATNSLYGWSQPELPEDLCLLRDEQDPWLVSIAHEKDGYFVLSRGERARLLDALPQLANLLIGG